MIIVRKTAQLAFHQLFHTVRGLAPRAALRENVLFRDVHRGQRCFILGSGGSILQQDLKRLAGEVVITQNSFHLHEDIAAIAPRYHCVVPMYQPPEFAADWVTWLAQMNDRLPADTHLFAGLNSRGVFEKEAFFRGRVSYLDAVLEPLLLRRAPVDLTRAVMVVRTALTQCLTVAIHMGFSQIYLLGFDLTQLCEGSQRNFGRFYGTSVLTANAAERNAEQDADWTGDNWFQYWSMWRAFVLLREEARRRGSEIINAAPAGLLDCFPRRRYEDIIGA